jgi:hypothetical protein
LTIKCENFFRILHSTTSHEEENMPRPYGLRFEDDLLTWFRNLPQASAGTKAACEAALTRRPNPQQVQLGDLWRDHGMEDNQDPAAQNTPTTNPRLKVLSQEDWKCISDAFDAMLRDPAYAINPAGRFNYRVTMPHTCCTWTCCAVVVPPKMPK